MTEDEQTIRKLIETWMDASGKGDVATCVSLMTKDVVFMVPGRDPFGREVFESAARAMNSAQIQFTNEIAEIQYSTFGPSAAIISIWK